MIHLDSNKRIRPYDTIGGAIKHYRKKNGWTQAQLAVRLKVCQSNIAHYESNKVTPPISKLKLLARELGCSLALLCDHKTSFISD